MCMGMCIDMWHRVLNAADAFRHHVGQEEAVPVDPIPAVVPPGSAVAIGLCTNHNCMFCITGNLVADADYDAYTTVHGYHGAWLPRCMATTVHGYHGAWLPQYMGFCRA